MQSFGQEAHDFYKLEQEIEELKKSLLHANSEAALRQTEIESQQRFNDYLESEAKQTKAVIASLMQQQATADKRFTELQHENEVLRREKAAAFENKTLLTQM